MISKLVCFFVCHGGAADHFATFSKELEKNGHEVQIYASGPALKKLQDKNIKQVIPFDEKEPLIAESLAKTCKKGQTVIVDLGHDFSEPLLKSLARREIKPLAYYDNAEPYVPGGYSSHVAKAVSHASKVLFANAQLAKTPIYETPNKEIFLPYDKRIGLGYYPLEQAENIAHRRKLEHSKARSLFLQENKIEDLGQKVLVYFGGNNTEYFEKAFPAFLSFLQDLSDSVIVLQQHPGARAANIDAKMLNRYPKILLSSKSSEEMQVIADGALYYQTSMGPLFAWAGIPRAQVGHEVYSDVLIRGGLCQVATSPSSFLRVIKEMKEEPVSKEQKKIILDALGIRKDWVSILEKSLT